MKALRRLAMVLVAGLAVLFIVARPIVWTEAALVMWDVAAGGNRTLWQG